MAFTAYDHLPALAMLGQGIDKFQKRQSLADLGQGIDGSPEGYANAAQRLLAVGDVNGATNFLALGEKAKERKQLNDARANSIFAPRSPSSPVAPSVGGGLASVGSGTGFTPRPTVTNTEEEVQALEGSTGTPGQIVAGRLVQNGLSPTAAAGVASNLSTESRFNPNALNRGDGRDGSDSIGMAQWNGPRAQALKQFAEQQGKDWRDRDVQADFVAYELRTSEGKSGAAIAGAGTPQQAAQAAIGYLRPSGYSDANPMGALKAGERVGGANQYVLGGEPAPAGQFTPQPGQVAQAPQPQGGGVYAGVPEPVLTGFLNNPKVPENYKQMMRQELASRQNGQPPVQVAEAAPQPGTPMADAVAPGATAVVGPATTQAAQGFAIPGTSLPPNDPAPHLTDAQLLGALRDPLAVNDHAAAKMILDNRMKYRDENAPDKRELMRLQVEKARRDAAGDTTRSLITPEERTAAGVDPSYKGTVQQDRNGKITYPGKATTEVNIDQKAETAYATSNGKAISDRFKSIVEEGDAANQEAGTLARLRELGGAIKNVGSGAALQGWLAERGIKVGENVSEIEAYNALVDKLTPQQRIAGAGATSDYDAKMFKNSLPGLIRTPGGNELIQSTMEALNAYKRQRGDIVAESMATNEKPAEVIKKLKELPDPFAAFKDARKASMQGGGAPSPAAAAAQPSALVSAPREAADFLRSNPALADQFDAKYGAGAASKVLGQ